LSEEELKKRLEIRFCFYCAGKLEKKSDKNPSCFTYYCMNCKTPFNITEGHDVLEIRIHSNYGRR